MAGQEQTRTIHLDCGRIEVRWTGDGSGAVTTFGLHDGTVPVDTEEAIEIVRYNAAIDAIGSMVLAQARAGIDITTQEYATALQEALSDLLDDGL